MTKLVALIVGLLATPVFAAATLVQTSDNGTPDHVQWIDYGTSTQSMTFGSNLTNGNSVICGAGAYHSDSGLEFTLPSDASTNTYTERADSGAQANSRAYVWAAHAITGGITTVTLNISGIGGGGLYGQGTCQEWSGLAASPNDSSCQGTIAGTAGDDAESNCTTATLAQAEELVWCLSHMASDGDSNVNYADPTTGSWTNVFRVQDAATNSAGSADRRTTSATTAVVVQYAHDELPDTTRVSIACATFKVAATSTWHWRRRR